MKWRKFIWAVTSAWMGAALAMTHAQTAPSSAAVRVECVIGMGESSLTLTAHNLGWVGYMSSNAYRFNSSILTCEVFMANSPAYRIHVFHTNGIDRQAMWGMDPKNETRCELPVKIVWGSANYDGGRIPDPMSITQWTNAYRYIIDQSGNRIYQRILSGASLGARPTPLNFAVDATGLPETTYKGSVFFELSTP